MRKFLMTLLLLGMSCSLHGQGNVVTNQVAVNFQGAGTQAYLIATTPPDGTSDSDHMHLVATFSCSWAASCNSTIDLTLGNRNGFYAVYAARGVSPTGLDVHIVAYRQSDNSTNIYLIMGNGWDTATYSILENMGDTALSSPQAIGSATLPGTLAFDTASPSYPPANYSDFSGNFSAPGNFKTSGLFLEKSVTFTPTTVGWYRIINQAAASIGGTIKITGAYDNVQTDVEYQFNMNGYSVPGSIQETRFASYNGGAVSQVRISSDGNNNLYMDIYVPTASNPSPITIYGYGPLMVPFVASPAVGAVAGSASLNSLVLGPGLRTSTMLATGGGILFPDGTMQSTAFINQAAGTGVQNLGIGYGALANVTSADYNTGVGPWALNSATTSYANIALGFYAGASITTGDENIAIGPGALQNLTTGSQSIGIGYQAGSNATTSSDELFVSSVEQSSYANDKAYSLLYGQFSGNPGSLSGQQLTVNGNFYVPSGNIGIGTKTPGASLEVNGNVKLTSGSGASLTFADGTVQSTAWNGLSCTTAPGGDYAESIDVIGERSEYEPGDVMVIDPANPEKFLKSSQPYSSLVAGIYSTKPGYIGRRQTTDPRTAKGEIPMAMIGIVPTKVTTENGPIKIGDLLVTSSTTGYAMKGTDRNGMNGAILGKALGKLDSGTGKIEVLVSLQ